MLCSLNGCAMTDSAWMALVLGSLLAGGLLGWLLFGRETAALRRALAEREERFRDAVAGLAAESARAKRIPELQAEVDALRLESRELAAMKAQAEERERALAEQRQQIDAEFKAAAQAALEASQAAFLERAKLSFEAQQEKATSGLTQLLTPVGETLKRYEEGLKQIETARVDAYGGLKQQLATMAIGQQQVREEAQRLAQVLRSSPKARGRWGEQQLRNVLEMAGLSDHADFRTEVSVQTSEGDRLRPDAVVRVPGGRDLVIDAKCSLNSFEDAFNAADDAERVQHLKLHAASVRQHIEALGRKAYWDQFANAPDFVVMFIPGEHFLAAALEQDRSLYDLAFERRVILASPTNLIAIARTVAAVWRQEKMEQQAREIGELGKELYARLAVMGGHVTKLGNNLNTAVGAYNAFVGSLETQVLTQAKRFEALSIDVGKKAIEALPVIETTPRPLVKLPSQDTQAAE